MSSEKCEKFIINAIPTQITNRTTDFVKKYLKPKMLIIEVYFWVVSMKGREGGWKEASEKIKLVNNMLLQKIRLP